jgi:succinate dehydrogenase/fumarate reductase cytochrome b subunit
MALGQRSGGNIMDSAFAGLLGLIILVLDIWAILSVLKSPIDTRKKIIWILLIVLFPLLGLLLWSVVGPRRNLKF